MSNAWLFASHWTSDIENLHPVWADGLPWFSVFRGEHDSEHSHRLLRVGPVFAAMLHVGGVIFLVHDTDIAIRKAREQHQKEPESPRREPPQAQATDAQIDKWEKHLRETLTERHRNATAQIQQRHRLDLQKTPDGQKLRMRHFNERAAFEDRKRIDRENLEQKIASARASRSIPDKFCAAAYTAENLADWADRQQKNLKERHNSELEKFHSAYFDRPETQASIKQWEQDLFALETAQEGERRDLDQTIAIAHETGRISDREPPGHDRAPGMER